MAFVFRAGMAAAVKMIISRYGTGPTGMEWTGREGLGRDWNRIERNVGRRAAYTLSHAMYRTGDLSESFETHHVGSGSGGARSCWGPAVCREIVFQGNFPGLADLLPR